MALLRPRRVGGEEEVAGVGIEAELGTRLAPVEGRSRARSIPHGNTATRRFAPGPPSVAASERARFAETVAGRSISRATMRAIGAVFASRRSSPWKVVTWRPRRTASEQAPVSP